MKSVAERRSDQVQALASGKFAKTLAGARLVGSTWSQTAFQPGWRVITSVTHRAWAGTRSEARVNMRAGVDVPEVGGGTPFGGDEARAIGIQVG